MGQKDAKARIKINKLLEDSGWQFFDSEGSPADYQLEPHTKINQSEFDAFGVDFERMFWSYFPNTVKGQ